MSQKTLNSYFSVKKRPVNQHAAKTRKLEKSQPGSQEIKDKKRDEIKQRREESKERTLEAYRTTPGPREIKNKKHDEMVRRGEETEERPPLEEYPTKAQSEDEKGEAPKQTDKVLNQLVKCTPDQIKAKLGQVNKLSELKARIQELNKDKNFANTGESKHRRQLFSPSKLSKEGVTLEVDAFKLKPTSSPSSPVKSGIKASPRKVPQYVKHDELLSPDVYMPLPRKYKFLAEVFRSVDDVVGMKYNRKEVIRVADLKPAVQNIIRKNFNNHYLRQIRCVLPKAYIYTWEKILDRLGRHSSGEYELQMTPDMNYNAPLPSLEGNIIVKAAGKLGPKEKVERLKLFNHSLLQIAKDYHQEFLEELGWNTTELKKEVTKWHPKFDAEENCPEIDTVDFPPKPHVEKMTNAKDMIEKFAGINPRLENVLQDRKEQPLVVNEKEMPKIKNPEVNTKTEEPKILKGLKGLPDALLKKILEKEKEKNVKDVTQDTEKRKRIEQMEELIAVSSVFVNCHRSIKNGAAVQLDILTKRVADSYGHGKTKEEMLKLLKMFLNLAPECMELRSYDRITYVKKKKDSPDINAIKAKLQKLVDQEKNS